MAEVALEGGRFSRFDGDLEWVELLWTDLAVDGCSERGIDQVRARELAGTDARAQRCVACYVDREQRRLGSMPATVTAPSYRVAGSYRLPITSTGLDVS